FVWSSCSLSHLFCVVVRISPFIRWPNLVCHYNDDETWVLFNAMNGNRAEMSPEAAGIAACLMTYSHHACRTECYAMTVHYYRLRDYALQHPECSAIMRIID
ncbi:antirestriction protein, partial [Escherichia coli]|uniref:antirestriction protein n=1 Tax=Escherichia coli TaxID=562 RepID=UPI0021D07D89